MKSFFSDIYHTFVFEAKIIFADKGILLIASLAILIYGFIYSYAYSPEILQKVPTIVVDQDRSKQSVEFIEALASSPNINVVAQGMSMAQAREMVLQREAFAIVYIAQDFGERIATSRTAYFSSYSDASYFLAYKQFFLATNSVMMEFNKEIKQRRYMLSGKSPATAKFLSQPIDYTSTFLYNHSQGYGSFLMPAILLLIIQQTILLASGMVFGKQREFNALGKLLKRSSGAPRNAIAVVVGRSIYYVLSNLLMWSVVLVAIYPIFNFIDNGTTLDVMRFVVPYILSSTMLGLLLSTFLKERSSALLYIFFSSIPLLFLSGISWPTEGMPSYMVWVARLVPSTSAVDGFALLESAGASLSHVRLQHTTLWVLTAVWSVAACARYSQIIKREE